MWTIHTLKEGWIKTSKIVIFLPDYSSSGSQVAGASPRSLGGKAGTRPGQDAIKSQRPPTPTPTQRQCRYARSPHGHSFWKWEETRAPGENPRGHGENMQTPSSGRGQEPFFVFSPHQHYNEMTLDVLALAALFIPLDSSHQIWW